MHVRWCITFLVLFSTLAISAANPKHQKVKSSPKQVRDRYIVAIGADAAGDLTAILRELAHTHKAKFNGSLEAVFRGGDFEMTEDQANAIAEDPRVEAVWEATEVQVTGPAPTVVTPRNWNLDRVDARTPRLNNSYSYCMTGRSVRAYVVDTGIWAGHDEFSNPDPDTGGSRVPLGWDYASTNRSNNPPCSHSEFNETALYGGSHGTAVASVLGGKTLGIAREVVLVPVRAMGCDGLGADVNLIAGLQWILQDPGHVVNPRLGRKPPRVVNMSLERPVTVGSGQTPLETAIQALIDNGITVVVAAGNGNTSTAGSSPARFGPAIVAGGLKGRSASDPDTRWNDGPTTGVPNPGSNYGPSIDVFAPADRVLVAQWTSTTATRDPNDNRYSSGTSFATPLVAGAIARYMQSYLWTNTPAQMEQQLINDASTGVHGVNIIDRRDSPNRVLYADPYCLPIGIH
ncbi:MAG TPA: S8 family serine peptidase [Thermoanaerobaculia bacterium]|nr:S8 family serine peptidase [Thermoanaerobaculia bacterium]